jgi:hypothetical protein
MTSWSFYYTPAYTRIITLTVKNVSIKATVTVTCKGGGCPYSKVTMKVPLLKRCGARHKSLCGTADVALAPRLKSRHLSVGTRITVIVSRPQWVAKYYTFTVRAARGPKSQVSCLAPGRTRPGVGCSP